MHARKKNYWRRFFVIKWTPPIFLSCIHTRRENFMTMYGYARVSRHDQNEARQINALVNFGVNPDFIFIDKCSGKDFNRPQYQKMLDTLQPNDTVVVQSIDRFGRNYYDNLNQVHTIRNEKHADFVVIDSPTIDTRNNLEPDGNLMVDMSIMVASHQAEREYNYIHQRQAEGIAIAKQKGIHCGHPYKTKPENFDEVYQQWKDKQISGRSAAQLLGVNPSTFLRWTKNM